MQWTLEHPRICVSFLIYACINSVIFSCSECNYLKKNKLYIRSHQHAVIDHTHTTYPNSREPIMSQEYFSWSLCSPLAQDFRSFMRGTASSTSCSPVLTQTQSNIYDLMTLDLNTWNCGPENVETSNNMLKTTQLRNWRVAFEVRQKFWGYYSAGNGAQEAKYAAELSAT